MIRPTSYTVERAYQGRDGEPRVFLRGVAMPVLADEPFNEGDSVILRDGRAVRAGR